MQVHIYAAGAAVVKIDAFAYKCGMDAPHIPDKKISAWIELLRSQKTLLNTIEKALKEAGYPPLTWYDVLLELRKAEEAGLRPMELETRILLPQYGLSRLLNRMQRAGLIVRSKDPEDGRGQIIEITDLGRRVQADMWPVYATALKQAFGDKLTTNEATELHDMLARFRSCQGKSRKSG